MFALGKNKHDQSLTAIVPQQDGLSVVTVKRDTGNTAIVNTANYFPSATDTANGHSSQQKLLQEKVRLYGLAKRPCTTILEIGDYSMLSVEAPDVPQSELRQAIRWQIKDLIDFHIDDAILDVFDAPASGADGRQHNLYVVVAKLSTVQERVTALQGVDVNLTTIDIPELVLRNISTTLPEDQNGVAFIYLAKDKGLLILTRNNTLYLARVLGMGYESLLQTNTNEYSQGLGEGALENEVCDNLVLEIQRSLDYYDRYFVQPPISGIVFSPIAGDLTDLLGYVGNSLGVATRMIDLNEIVQSDVALTPEQQAHCLLAIGAALRTEKKSL